ncbi:MAG TPA: FIST N-terminal domain-containing protein [Leptospiraceae bacterium]|nr:FIST N-terminal domain-containing protein [Leptospiraceae bacterium]HMX31752.1 FIST N-terminal domain-containing protein [Leptospiraceae bacterium]HMY30558.1 FIST N-terminal domain-containing protein [Leptospiraceae bacterium]HMZ64141.1 FIST N-terminal domain-containing protein [Leptospiraceae bacterium]HNA08751.1 FIST N-terminal domain-containing protein [Leptospiraceae bacterium]
MKIEQYIFENQQIDYSQLKENRETQVLFLFGAREIFEKKEIFQKLKGFFPNAIFFGCTTSGEIFKNGVYDLTLTVTALQFEKTKVKFANTKLVEWKDSYTAGKFLANSLDHDNLTHVLVLSDGIHVNGSDLTKGISDHLPTGVGLTGGLSGDAARFEKTFVLVDDTPEEGAISVLGLYGKEIQIGSASMGGWDIFGPERRITKSKGNVLFELDGEPVLTLYKKYLGDAAKDLPASALRFPLNLKIDNLETGVVRTILGMNEEEGSLTFAGDMPEGAYTNLMKANYDRLIDGASGAAEFTSKKNKDKNPELALLISCVGRKLVLDQRVEEEIEAVRDVYGENTIITGFYSYGEISPFTPDAKCSLHNQTMTITTFSEK